MHGELITPYDATDVPEPGADQRTNGRHDEHSHDFAQFLKKASIMSAYGITGSFGGNCLVDAVCNLCSVAKPHWLEQKR